MDRHRGGDRGGGERHRGPSRWSDGPPANHRYSSRGGGGGGGGFDGGGRNNPYRGGSGAGGPPDYPSGGGAGGGGFNGGGRHHPYRGSGGSGGGPSDYPSGGGGGGGAGLDGGTRHHSYRGGGGEAPLDFSSGGGGGAGGPGFRHGPDGPGGFGQHEQIPTGGGQRRGGGFSGSGRGGSPDNTDSSNFAKLFIGSVPRTATEEDIRPLFEEHGNVIEVALIKDRRTGQQQGCCFVKYATSEEADRAIRALHNQYTLPGGHGPIQVRYADGERERLVEYKLFVGSLNKQATEKEVEEIFSPYGRVEDVYIMKDDMKQSRGCGFVKFSNRDMAAAAIDALNGKYTMRGCDQPLTVRFADPKRPRPGESRGGPAFGGPGYGSRSQPPLGVRSTPNLGEPITERRPPNAHSGWHPASPRSRIPTSQVSTHDSDIASKSGAPASSSLPVPFGALGGPMNGSLPGLALISSSMAQQGFSPSLAQGPMGQQMAPLQKPLLSPQHLPPSLQMHPLQQTPVPYSQGQTFQAPMQQLGQLQIAHSGGLPSLNQGVPSQQLIGLGGQLPTSQPLMQPLNMQQQGMSAASQQQLAASNVPHQLLQQPVQQSPTHMMLQQQTQSLQSTFQSTQQAFSQLQQQLQQMQPTLNQQQGSQATKQQSPWSGTAQHSVSSSPATGPAAVAPSTMSTTPTLTAEPLACNWTEHTSPEGYKYYYNSITKESKWEKPEELTLFEQQQQQQQKLQLQQQQQSQQQQQQQQKSVVPQLQSQSQPQLQTQVPSAQHIAQLQQVQAQMQIRQQAPTQFLQPSLAYQASGAVSHQNTQELSYVHVQVPGATIDPVRVQQGLQAAQEWMWKNKPAGA